MRIWIAACAFYPSLHWQLTLHLGILLQDYLNRSDLVSLEKLLEFTRLPWFIEGRIPDPARDELLEWLQNIGKEQPLRGLLLQSLNKAPAPPDGSAAYAEYRMQVVFNEWMLENDPVLKTKLEEEFSRYLGAGKIPDFVSFKRLERKAKQSDFVIPESWRPFLAKEENKEQDEEIEGSPNQIDSTANDSSKIRIQEAILHIDYDIAFIEIQKAMEINFDRDQLAYLLEEVAFVFYATGNSHRAREALQLLTGLGLPKYVPLATALSGIIEQPGFRPLLDNLQKIPDSIAALIKSRYLPEMLFVEGGNFIMGSNESKEEKPPHEVYVDGFYLQKTPVTFWQYMLFQEAEGLDIVKPNWGGQGDNPVVKVSWEDTIRFCNWLSVAENLQPVYRIEYGKVDVNWQANGYRLPTEAEWEYAARGGTNQDLFRFSGGYKLKELGWYFEISENRTHSVNQKQSNSLGLHDMSGNVWEWCYDWYSEKYYHDSSSHNPKGASSGSNRVARGGSWESRENDCRVTTRRGFNPISKDRRIGFRLAQSKREEALMPNNKSFSVKASVEQAIYSLEYDFAFQEIQNASILKFDQNQIAYLLEEITFVFHASGKYDRAKEAFNLLNSFGFQRYNYLSEILPEISVRPGLKLLLDTLEQIPNGAAPLIKSRYFPKMIKIQGGSFMMGSNNEKRGQPVHRVTLNGFYLQETPVTYWQYNLFLQHEALKVEKPVWGRHGDNPAVNVSWNDAVRFCNWLSHQEGLQPVYRVKGKNTIIDWSANGYRLPTEAEWEYAARGGKDQKSFIYSGSDNLDEVGWYLGTAEKRTHPVRLKNPNTLGLYDMSGNVWEWCQDRYGKDYYKYSPSINPKGSSASSFRILRGGSWDDYQSGCRVTYRSYSTPVDRNVSIGFRLSRKL